MGICKTIPGKLFAVFFFLCAFFVISCATPPKAGIKTKDSAPDFSILPPGGRLYLWADAARAKPILEALSINGFTGKDASQILDRTNTVIAAFYPVTVESGIPSRRFFLAGHGNYPNLMAGFSMTFNRNWKKIKSKTGNRYWFNKSSNIGMALGSKLAFVSDGDPFEIGPVSGSQEKSNAPDSFEEFRKPCVLAGRLNNPGALVNGFIAGLGIPLQIPAEELFFGFVRAGESADAAASFAPVIKIRASSTSQAAALTGLLSIARMFIGGATEGESPSAMLGHILSNTPVQEGEYVRLNAPPMSISQITLLFRSFALYSPKKDT